MSNLRDIKQRITSVKKTQKITLAMKMVAAAKFKRSQNNLKEGLHYANTLNGVLKDLISRVDNDELPALAKTNNGTKEAVIIVAGDRGLCGGFNTNILKAAITYLAQKNKDDLELILIGNKAGLFFKNKDYTIKEVHRNLGKDINSDTINSILEPIIEDYIQGTYGKVSLFYNKFISALANTQEHVPLFPLDIETEQSKSEGEESDFIYEPDKLTVLTELMTAVTENKLHIALLNSRAAEEGSRMAAMDSASENASDVIYQLTLSYNRSRQAAITTEISEIVAGAASLE